MTTEPGPYPKSTMRVLGAIGLVLGVLLVVWGFSYVARGNSGGWTMIGVGAACAGLIALLIPFARKRGRM